MKISRKDAIELMEALGHKKVVKWGSKRLQTKVDALLNAASSLVMDNLSTEQAKTLSKILRSQKKGREVLIVVPEKSATKSPTTPSSEHLGKEPEEPIIPEESSKEVPPIEKKSAKKDTPVKKAPESKTEVKSPSKKKSAKKKKVTTKPKKINMEKSSSDEYIAATNSRRSVTAGLKVGIIKTIDELIMRGKPISKPHILDILEKAFPNRPRESMSSTLNAQLPTRMKQQRGIITRRTKSGKYVLVEKIDM